MSDAQHYVIIIPMLPSTFFSSDLNEIWCIERGWWLP